MSGLFNMKKDFLLLYLHLPLLSIHDLTVIQGKKHFWMTLVILAQKIIVWNCHIITCSPA